MSHSFSRLLALSLAGASVVAMAAPANAQSSRRQSEQTRQAAPAPEQRVSRAFQTAYPAVNTAITASNWAAADAAIAALRAVATTPYERFIVAQSEFRVASGQQLADRQAAAVTAMIDSGGIPTADQARVYTAGSQIAYNARDYANAASRAQRAIQLGATEPVLEEIVVDALFRSNQTDAGLARVRTALDAARAAGRPAPESVYSRAAAALQNANRPADLLNLLIERATAYPTAFNVRTATQIYLQQTPDDRGRTIDALRLMRAANAINDRRYWMEYAGDLIEDGAPNEAVEVIAAARAANAAPAGDTTFREMETMARGKLAEDRASLAGSEARARTRPDAQLATRVADAYLSWGNFAKAEELYRLALTKTGADTGLINTRLGITRYRAGNRAGAIEAFNAVTGQRQALARLWAAHVNSGTAGQAAPVAAPAPARPSQN